jgi:hypothetical protein
MEARGETRRGDGGMARRGGGGGLEGSRPKLVLVGDEKQLLPRVWTTEEAARSVLVSTPFEEMLLRDTPADGRAEGMGRGGGEWGAMHFASWYRGREEEEGETWLKRGASGSGAKGQRVYRRAAFSSSSKGQVAGADRSMQQIRADALRFQQHLQHLHNPPPPCLPTSTPPEDGGGGGDGWGGGGGRGSHGGSNSVGGGGRPRCSQRLNTQWRMPRPLAAFAAAAFYRSGVPIYGGRHGGAVPMVQPELQRTYGESECTNSQKVRI